MGGGGPVKKRQAQSGESCVELELADNKSLQLNGSEATTGVSLDDETTHTTKQPFPNLETVVLRPLILEVKL